MTSQDILFQNLDADVPIECIDTDARFSVADVEHSQTINHEEALVNMIKEWDAVDSRQLVPDTGGRACQIDTAPESIEATFKGIHECFQYTKV